MQSFLSACGLAEPLQLVVESPTAKGGELRLLHQPFALIGRDSRADLVLDHARVSRRHVYFQMIEGRAFWVDLESRTGTRIGGEVRKHGWLVQGRQPLCVGPYIIRRISDEGQTDNRFSADKPLPAPPFVAAAYSSTPLPEVALEFLNGPSQATTWPVRRVMSFIGSAVGCKFRLTDASVSRFHASFLRTSGGLWIVDLLGQGGITVNEVPVRFSHLTDGDLITVGRYQIQVRCRLERQGSSSRVADRSAIDFPQPRRRERISGVRKSVEHWAATQGPFVPGTELMNLAQFPLAVPALSTQAQPDIFGSEVILSPLKLSVPGGAESILVPLVNQFGVMQQQMFDQFQQAMAMMLQMFGTMHREQMEVIRRELDQLHDLTEEFRALRDELALRTREGGEMLAADPSDTVSEIAEALRATIPAAPAPVATGTSEATSNPRSRPDNKSLANQPPLWPSSPEPEPSPASPVAHSPPLAPKAFTPTPLTESVQQPLAADREKTAGPTAPAEPDRDSVAWLHQRIMTLQRERETRWQKILKLLPGIS
jgi:pSer/pThr/pTyr-binding forkhead associated (FHA) protein